MQQSSFSECVLPSLLSPYSRHGHGLCLALAHRVKFLLKMILKRRHILRSLTAMKAHQRGFKMLLVVLWCEVSYHLCELMLVIEPRAYIIERKKELGAGTERVVMSLGLERRTDQIGRDDVQMEMS